MASGNTPVLTARGAVRIDALEPTDEVLAFFEDDNAFAVHQRPVKATVRERGDVEVVVEVRLRNGVTLLSTPDQRFLMHTFERGYAWREAGQLRKGDPLVVPDTRALPGYEAGLADDPEAVRAGEAIGRDEEAVRASFQAAFLAQTSRDIVARATAAAVGITSSVAADLDAALDRFLRSSEIAGVLRGLYGTLGDVITDEENGEEPAVELSIRRPLDAGAPVMSRVTELLRRFGVDATYEFQDAHEFVTITGLSAMERFVASGIPRGAFRKRVNDAIQACGGAPAATSDAYDRHSVTLTHVQSARPSPSGQARVYDLAVPGANHFIASGVVAAHATGN